MSEWNLLMTAKRGSTSTDARGLITITDKASGEFSDRDLRLEKKRFGWKRINESYAERKGCKPYGFACCADETCQRATMELTRPINIFYKDTSNTCQP